MSTKLKTYFFLIILSLITMVSSCFNKTYQLLYDNATFLYQDEQYEDAYQKYIEIYNTLLQKNKQIEDEILGKIAQTAYLTNRKDTALLFFKKVNWTKYSSPGFYYFMANCYRDFGDIQAEIDALENFKKKYPFEKEYHEAVERLFLRYIELNRLDKASENEKLLLNSSKEKIKIITGYYDFFMQKGDKKRLDYYARKILEKDSKNTKALYHLAKKYYWIAENRYKREMAAYEKNKTKRQYIKLLDALEQISANYRISRNYFLRLYKIEPNSKNAAYLANIYGRLNNKKMAEYYKRKAKNMK